MKRIAIKGQRGATLLISLIMLVVLTMFAISSFNLSSTNLRITGNFQQQRYIEASVQQAIDQALSTSTMFSLTPSSQTITVNGFTVSLNAPSCNYVSTATGYQKNLGSLAPEDSDWEVRASATDSLGGATATITQGVRVRLLEGNCP